MLKELVAKSRSYRRFDEAVKISRQTLVGLVDLARLSPSGANMQPLKFYVSADAEKNESIFPTLGWAGYLKEWAGPEAGERPTGYILVLKDKGIAHVAGIDHGIAAQSIMLGAVEKGLGGCYIGNIDRPRLFQVTGLSPDDYEILLVLALGKPIEQVVVDDINENGDVKYWRDASGVHHVPKRTLQELVVG